MRRVSVLATLLIACVGSGDGGTELPLEPPPVGITIEPTRLRVAPAHCDAGDIAWVMRAMPLLWGRKPHGAAEVRLWAKLADDHGRPAVVRAMARDDAFEDHWREWFTDALQVARVGDKEFSSCFADSRQPNHDGGLTEHLRTEGPEVAWPTPFTMADVVTDALVADDVSTIFQAHLFARMARPVQGANVSLEQLEYNRRVSFGEVFFVSYLGRTLGCLACHNSEFSVTDHPDPDLDRTWQLPGLFERALLGDSGGIDPGAAYAVFRHAGVARTFSGESPWGLTGACGRLAPRDEIPTDDLLGEERTLFIEELGPTGSVYDLERAFAQGVDELAADGLTLSPDAEVGGPEAFAYLVATNLADQVWAEATGAPLTVAHHFPRNAAQAARLKSMADVLATQRFSLQALLVAVTSDDHFNPGLPTSCRARPYGLDPIFDPWTAAEEVAERRGNDLGDASHRLSARSLLRTTHENLGWPARARWHGLDWGPEEALQEALGVFLRESSPGHSGSDFQGTLAWERAYGTCGMGGPQAEDDFVSQVVRAAMSEQAAITDVAHAIKDRLTSQGIDERELELVAGLFGRPPSDPVEADKDLARHARLLCGAILLSPQFQLVTDQTVGPVPRLARGVADDCAKAARLMTEASSPIACHSGGLTLP